MKIHIEVYWSVWCVGLAFDLNPGWAIILGPVGIIFGGEKA